MKILITNIWLVGTGGTEMYTKELALSLKKRGHEVGVYSPELGALAQSIQEAGVVVVDCLDQLKFRPDVIHTHQFRPSLEAILFFPEIPVVYVLHDREFPGDFPPDLPQIVRHIAVDKRCLQRLIVDNQISERACSIIPNWVNTQRFKQKQEWNLHPKRAAVFSNYATKDNYAVAIQEACQVLNIPLDIIGHGAGTATQYPEKMLWKYDVVFAKAKAAMEAMASGAFVILCDFKGLGEAVSLDNFEHLRTYNFGAQILTKPHDSSLIIKELKKYNRDTAKKVSNHLRESAGLEEVVDELCAVYTQAKDQEIESQPQKQANYQSILRLLQKEEGRVKNLQQNLSMENSELQARIQELQLINKEITQSWSFKLGRILTAPLRLLLGKK